MDQGQVFHLPEVHKQRREHILVIGVGGGGGNALNHIIESGVEGVEFIAANTDAKALDMSKATHKITLGEKLTKGHGAGANPQVGMDAAKESIEHIRDYISGADMIFVTAGMGGGTGTGAAPIIAEVAKEMKVLVVAVVTTPFSFEGRKRSSVAKEGIAKLREKVDALLVVENDKLLDLADDKLKSVDAFKMANEVLRQAVQGVTDLILKPGLINVDFADVQTIMRDSGAAIMGIGVGEGDNKAEMAARTAIKSPLISQPLKGAKGILFNIETTPDVALREINKAAVIINETAHEDAQIIWGHVFNEDLGNVIRITVIATGFTESGERGNAERSVSSFSSSSSTDKKDPPAPPRLKRTESSSFLFDDVDLQLAEEEEDMFLGMPKTAYDAPAIMRRRQKK
jgi:cell division protein FtsZ